MVKRLIQERVNRLWGPFTYDHGDLPEIDFKLTGTTAGQVHHRKEWDSDKYYATRLRFNVPIAEKNLEDFLARTIPHELAHILAIKKWGHAEGKGHGTGWKRACRELGMNAELITRCHSYDVPRTARRPKDVKCIKCDHIWHVTRAKWTKAHSGKMYHPKCMGRVNPA